MAVTINGTNGIAVPLGSASAPAETNTTSSTTGIYYPTSTTLGLSTNGTNAVTIDASQNVGIGVSSPADTAAYGGKVLDIKGPTYLRDTSGGSNYFSSGVVGGATYLQANGTANFLAISTNNAERMRIDASGNVGIGTSSPSSYAKLASLSADDNNTFAAVASNGLIRLKGYLTSAGASVIEATNITQSAYAPMLLNGSTLLLGTGNTERARIDSSGNLLVGTTSSNSGKITVLTTGNGSISCAQTGTTGDMIYFRTSTNTLAGYIQCPTGTTTSYVSVSDYRLKENVTPIATGLEKILALKPVTYDWISDKLQGEGFIAHELQEVIPLAVAGEKDAVNEDGSIRPQGVDPAKIVVHLVKAIQELSAEVEALKAKVGA